MPRHPVRDIPAGTRWCPSCKRGVLFADYTKTKGGPGGFGGSCKPCKAASKKAAEKRRAGQPDPTAATRFWAKVRKTKTCWHWTATKRHGHGHFMFEGRMQRAHRVALILAGVKIPEGMHIDHVCRNRACVRVEHLRIVTPAQNALENNLSPFAALARQLTCKAGHPWIPENLAVAHIKRRKNRHGTWTYNKTSRSCRICKNARAREYHARKRALARNGQ